MVVDVEVRLVLESRRPPERISHPLPKPRVLLDHLPTTTSRTAPSEGVPANRTSPLTTIGFVWRSMCSQAASAAGMV